MVNVSSNEGLTFGYIRYLACNVRTTKPKKKSPNESVLSFSRKYLHKRNENMSTETCMCIFTETLFAVARKQGINPNANANC